MILDFNNMPVGEMKNFKGGEKSVFAAAYADSLCRIMKVSVPAGASIGLHTHEGNCEVVFCLSGNAKAVYDGVEERIVPGTAHYCPKDHNHTVINDGTEDFVAFAVIPQQ